MANRDNQSEFTEEGAMKAGKKGGEASDSNADNLSKKDRKRGGEQSSSDDNSIL